MTPPLGTVRVIVDTNPAQSSAWNSLRAEAAAKARARDFPGTNKESEMDAREGRWKAALCPGCGKPADRTLMSGWLFHCKACDWSWGHPQHINRSDASEALYEAREKFDVRD